MITKQEVIDNYKEYETFGDDRFGRRFANYCYADELEKIGFGLQCSEEEWNKDVKDFTKKNIIKEMVEDAEFGYEKSMDNRGISTSLMSSVCESWVKILEDEDLIGLEMTALFVNIIEKYGGKKAYKLMTEEELIIELEDLSDENEKLKKEKEELEISINLFEDDVKKLSEENEELKQEVKQYWAYRDIRKQKIKDLEKQLNFLQNLISDAIQHQKTELGQKVLKEVIRDYNEFLLGHKGVE